MRPSQYKGGLIPNEEDHLQARVRHRNRYSGEKAHRGGEFGDPAGYEETLYQTPGGLYFLYFRGGPASAYAKEDIKCLAKGKVDAWVESH